MNRTTWQLRAVNRKRHGSAWRQKASAIGLATIGLFIPGASWGLLGDCGKPTDGSTVTVVDAAATLAAAVASAKCILPVCDVNDSGGVNATDANVLLQVAVGLLPSSVLDCPPMSSGIKTSCTQAAVKAKIDAINATPVNEFAQLTPTTSILLDCADTEIAIDESWPNPSLTHDAAFFGVDPLANITFALTPLCYQRCVGTCDDGDPETT